MILANLSSAVTENPGALDKANSAWEEAVVLGRREIAYTHQRHDVAVISVGVVRLVLVRKVGASGVCRKSQLTDARRLECIRPTRFVDITCPLDRTRCNESSFHPFKWTAPRAACYSIETAQSLISANSSLCPFGVAFCPSQNTGRTPPLQKLMANRSAQRLRGGVHCEVCCACALSNR